MKDLKMVAIVGRPNVGKSTLFNYIAKKNIAITSPIAGTTRDRLFETVEIEDKEFLLVDTGGIETIQKGDGFIEISIQEQVKVALKEADLLVFMVDSKLGLTDDDQKVAKMIRQSGKEVIFVASKVDSQSMMAGVANLGMLGMGEAHAISTKQGKGVDQLLRKIAKEIPKRPDLDEEESKYNDEVAISFIGRPNAGKSSLVNRLLGEDRQIVSEVAGTTRDSSAVLFDHNGSTIRFIDTAGVRRRNKVDDAIEHYSNIRSVHTISRSDVVVLVIDYEEGITAQDMKLASLIHESATGAIICVNKWDLSKENDSSGMNSFIEYVYKKLDFLEYAPIVFTSALTGQRVDNILDVAVQVEKNSRRHLETKKLNAAIERVQMKHPPARKTKKTGRPKIYFVTQVGVNPLEFVVFVNNSDNFHPSYFKYLERRLREMFELDGVGMKFLLRDKDADEGEKVGGKKFARKILGDASRSLKGTHKVKQ